MAAIPFENTIFNVRAYLRPSRDLLVNCKFKGIKNLRENGLTSFKHSHISINLSICRMNVERCLIVWGFEDGDDWINEIQEVRKMFIGVISIYWYWGWRACAVIWYRKLLVIQACCIICTGTDPLMSMPLTSVCCALRWYESILTRLILEFYHWYWMYQIWHIFQENLIKVQSCYIRAHDIKQKYVFRQIRQY